MMHCLSVRQPWASLLVTPGPGRKDVEVRSWRTHYRGQLVICAASNPDRTAHASIAAKRLSADERAHVDRILAGDLPRGVAVGLVDLVDATRDHRSPWSVPGSWQWVVSDPIRLVDPVPVTGRLGLWTPPPDLLDALTVTQPH